MRSFNRALQQRPEAFKAVGMVLTVHPFLFRVINRAMLVAEPCKLGVGLQFVRRNCGAPTHVRDNVRLKRRTTHILNDPRHHVTFAFQHPKHDRLAGSTPATLSARTLPADHRFVGLDMPRKLIVTIHKAEILANLMAHAPRRFVIHAKLALQFLRRNAVARRGEQVHRIEPLLQRRVRIIERGSNHRVNVLTALAGIGGHLRELAKLAYLMTARALEIVAIPQSEKVPQAGVVIREHPHKILDRQRLGHSRLLFLGDI